MSNYENIFICPVDTNDKAISEIQDKLKKVISKEKGEISSFDVWGRRRLAYPIHQHKEGIYVCCTFSAPGSAVKNLNQFLRISDRIVRHITVKKPH